MSIASFWQRGEALDYINTTGATIEANSILVIGSHLGVAGTEMAAGAVGSVHMVGVFEMPKTGTAAIGMGDLVYWDGDGITGTAPTGDDKIKTPVGYAAVAAEASAETVMVKLNG